MVDSSRPRTITASLLAASLSMALSGAVPAGTEGQTGAEQGFSRAESILRHLGSRPFSAGVIPGVESPGPSLSAPPTLSPLSGLIESAVSVGVSDPVRVNNDLVPPGGGANPESQAEPNLAINPNDSDNLIVVYQESRIRTGGARALNYATSFDGGLTWTEGSLPSLTIWNDGPWEKASDPWVAFGPDNRAYYTSLLINESAPDNAVAVSVSTDGGLTWGPPVDVLVSELDFNDKQAIEADSYSASPHSGNVYVAWDINVAVDGGFGPQLLVVARSVDGGSSYEPPVVVRGAGVNIGAIPKVGPNGTVYVVWSGSLGDGGRRHVFFSRSRDGGGRWSQPRAIAQQSANGVADLRVGTLLPDFAVDRGSGDLYVVWEDDRWTGSDQVAMIVSRDEGETWTPPRRASDGPADAPNFTAAVGVNPRGDVAVSYQSLRNDPDRRFLIDQFVQISRDRGSTFGPALRLSPATSDIRFAAWARGYMLGDYQGIVGGPADFHAVWVFPLLPSRLSLLAGPDSGMVSNPPPGIAPPPPEVPVRLQSDVFVSRVR